MIRSLFEYGVFRPLSKALIGVFLLVGAANAETVKIAALGDSLTAGYGLATDEGFVPTLQNWLIAQGAEIEIVNAGVSGDTTSGGLERVNWILQGGADGLIVALGGNDMLRGFPPELSKSNLSGIIEAAGAKNIPVLLIGMKASNNFGPSYKAQFDEIYNELSETYGVPLYDSFMRAIAEGRTLEDMRDLMQADGLHPNAEGIDLIVEAIGPEVLRIFHRE